MKKKDAGRGGDLNSRWVRLFTCLINATSSSLQNYILAGAGGGTKEREAGKSKMRENRRTKEGGQFR